MTLQERLDRRANKRHACVFVFPSVVAMMTGIAMVAFMPKSMTVTYQQASPLAEPQQCKVPYPTDWWHWEEVDPFAIASYITDLADEVV